MISKGNSTSLETGSSAGTETARNTGQYLVSGSGKACDKVDKPKEKQARDCIIGRWTLVDSNIVARDGPPLDPADTEVTVSNSEYACLNL